MTAGSESGKLDGLQTGRPVGLFRKVPIWAALTFCMVIVAAYSPNVLPHLLNVLNYDVLVFKGRGEHVFFHLETEHLFSIARPIAALTTNLPILPVSSSEGLRWVRAFAILTLCILGLQLMANCIGRLKTKPLDAVVIALATFLGLALIYSVMAATAWAAHLLTTFIVFSAYAVLGKSNLRVIPFLLLVEKHEWSSLGRQLVSYSMIPSVWKAALIYQFALYDYPPFALLILIFPVVGVLFSRAPRPYRTLIALRDVGFTIANLAVYVVSTKLIYLPLVRMFTLRGSGDAHAYGSDYEAALYAAYQYKYNTDIATILTRIEKSMVLAGDLWFLPQFKIYQLTGTIILLALCAGLGLVFFAKHVGSSAAVQWQASISRLQLTSSEGVTVLFVVSACFVISSSPVWGSDGGVLAYRTVVASTAIVAILLLFAISSLFELAWLVVRGSSAHANAIRNGALILAICVAFAGNYYSNFATMRLGQNEVAYFGGIVRNAIDNGSKAIFLIHTRRLGFDVSEVSDQRGRAVPPFELACFMSYCMQSDSVVRQLAAEQGRPYKSLDVLIPTVDEPVPGLTCDMLTAERPSYPAGATKRSVEVIDYYRTLKPLTCAMISLAWHDLEYDPYSQ